MRHKGLLSAAILACVATNRVALDAHQPHRPPIGRGQNSTRRAGSDAAAIEAAQRKRERKAAKRAALLRKGGAA
jgi:hypothetical protein